MTHPRTDCAKFGIHLAGWAAHDQRHNRVFGHTYVLVRAEDMNLGVGQHNACAARIFDSKASTTVFSGDTADRATKMVAMQSLCLLYTSDAADE